jgi:hypothetical protein
MKHARRDERIFAALRAPESLRERMRAGEHAEEEQQSSQENHKRNCSSRRSRKPARSLARGFDRAHRLAEHGARRQERSARSHIVSLGSVSHVMRFHPP